MAHASANPVISELRERISHLDGALSRRKCALPFGVPEIDSHLPGGGLALGAIHEFAGGGAGPWMGQPQPFLQPGSPLARKGK